MDSTFDFDPHLPALPLAFDLPAVARLFAEQWPRANDTQPIEITVRYEFIVDGVTQINLSATFDPGDLFAHGIYEPPPAVAGV